MEEWTTAQTFELYGPKNYSTKEISELVDREIIKKRRHINVPKAIMKPAAYWLNRLLWWPITSADEVEREFIDQQIDPTAKTFKDLGIEPTDLNTLTFHYLVCILQPSILLEILTNFSITAWIQKLPVRRSTASYRAGAQGGEKIPPCSGLSINWYYTIVLLAFLDLVCMYTQCFSDALKFLYLVTCTFQLVHARVTNGTPLVDYGFQVLAFFPKCSSPSHLRTGQWSQAIYYKYGPNSLRPGVYRLLRAELFHQHVFAGRSSLGLEKSSIIKAFVCINSRPLLPISRQITDGIHGHPRFS